jgi:phage terminase large subunit
MDREFLDFLNRERALSQSWFTFSRNRYTILGGGYGSGKTKAVIERGLFLSCFIPGNEGLIGRNTFAELETTTMNQFFEEISKANLDNLIIDEKKALKKVTLRTHDATNNKPQPSHIWFRHLFEPRPDKKHITGLNLGWAGVDQLEDVDEPAWNDLVGGRLRRQGVPPYAFASYNPKGHWWGYKRWKKPAIDKGAVSAAAEMPMDDQYVIHPQAVGFRRQPVQGVTGRTVNVEAYRVNPDTLLICSVTEENLWLGADYVLSARANNPPEWVARYLDGSDDEWSGKVYSEFSGAQSIHCLTPFPIPKDWPTIVGIDCGGDAPWAVIVARFDPIDGDCVITNEYYRSGILISEIARWIKNPAASGIPKWDSSNVIYVCDPENAQAIREFQENHDMPMMQRAKKGPKLPGIYRVAGYMHRFEGRKKIWPKQNYKHPLAEQHGDVEICDAPRLWVFAENCPNWVRETEDWEWARDLRTNESKEVPVDKDDHCCDATIYILRERPVVAQLIKEDPFLTELRKKDYMRFISTMETRLAMSLGTGEDPSPDRPTGEAFVSEAGGIEEKFEGFGDGGPIEW